MARRAAVRRELAGDGRGDMATGEPAGHPGCHRPRGAARAATARPGAFLAAFAAVWTVLGLLAFAGDVALHRVVDATPRLAARPRLIEAGVLALAGAYQLMPLERSGLAACRHPLGGPSTAPSREGDAARLGLAHALDCVESSSALMFAGGFANLRWMAVLAALMAYGTRGRRGCGARGSPASACYWRRWSPWPDPCCRVPDTRAPRQRTPGDRAINLQEQ